VRGNELDRRKNEILEAIEEQLDKNRKLSIAGVMDVQIRRIETVNRLPPLAELSIDVEVRYNYLRGNT
jgi:hypothetical protein